MNIVQKIFAGSLMGLMFIGTAAANVELDPGPNPVTALTCAQLANDIRIVLSANVVGGLECAEDDVIIGLSLCHLTGLTTSRTVTAQPKVGVGADAECVTGLEENANGTCDGTVIGAAVPSATTAQGTVFSRYPGVNCADATVALGEATLSVQEAAVAP